MHTRVSFLNDLEYPFPDSILDFLEKNVSCRQTCIAFYRHAAQQADQTVRNLP